MSKMSNLYYELDELGRNNIIELLSYKGFTTDELLKKSDDELKNLYVEYVVLEEDYV